MSKFAKWLGGKPVIHSVFPLTDVVQAHALMESSQHIGKIMLAIKR